MDWLDGICQGIMELLAEAWAAEGDLDPAAAARRVGSELAGRHH